MTPGDRVQMRGETWTVVEIEEDGCAWLKNDKGQLLCKPAAHAAPAPVSPWGFLKP